MGITVDKRKDITGDAIQIESSDGSTRISSTSSRLDVKGDPVDLVAAFCLLQDVLKQLKIITIHLQHLTDVEMIDGDEEDYLG